MFKISRNDSCPCGSGKKYKKCCMLDEKKKNEIERARILSSSRKQFLTHLNEEIMEYNFRITLNYIRGESIENVNRTMALSGDQTLHDLHLIIQGAFDWDNDHMYSFFISNKVWDRASEYSGNPLGEHIPENSFRGVSKSAGDTEIRDLAIKEKSVFKYLFDYGDELVHTIEVLEIKSIDKSKKQGFIHKNLFGFSLTNTVFFVFTGVAAIPLKAFNLLKVNHNCILPKYT